ncbi:MAG: Spy/CpxP family protein refolding chaperone [Thermoanaerobaculia bacterium]
MIKTKTMTSLILIAAVALVAPAPASAHDPGSGRGRGSDIGHGGHAGYGLRGPGMRELQGFGGPGAARAKGLRMALRHLDLSESQREEIKTIFEAEREAVEANHERMRSLANELRAQIENDPYDEEAVRAKAAALAEIGVDMAVLRARQAGQVMDVLGPDQREQLEQMKTRRDAFRQERRERFEQRREQRWNR